MDAAGQPTFPILHLLDTRSGDQVARVPNTHAPARAAFRIQLLAGEAPVAGCESPHEQVQATHRFLSFPEYFFRKLFGHAGFHFMVSATGLWNQNA